MPSESSALQINMQSAQEIEARLYAHKGNLVVYDVRDAGLVLKGP